MLQPTDGETPPGLLKAELRARIAAARGPYEAAVWHLLLGEADIGLAALRAGVPQLTALWPAAPHVARVALLADEADVAASIARAALSEPSTLVPGYREYDATLLSMIAGDEGQAARHQAGLETHAANGDKLRSGHPSRVADATGGLIGREPHRIADGLEALLAWHVRRARSRSDIFNSANAVVSLDAVTILLLAHRRSVHVPAPPAFRGVRLPLLVVHLTGWLGQPLPRATELGVVADLVAGPWLRAHGLAIDEPAPPAQPTGPAKRPSRPPRVPKGGDAIVARQELAMRAQRGGSPWQLASWLLMMGDPEAARARLQAAADDARSRWQATVPPSGGASRWFRRDQALPNRNIVREHFALALVLGDETGLRETIATLQAWLRTEEGTGSPIYGHALGYLDLLCDLVGGGDRARPSRAQVDRVAGGPASARVAAIGLVDRDPVLLRRGLEGILQEHTKQLERRSSPPPPICEAAAQLGAAAHRLGVPVTVDERYGSWPVPVEGARLPCDLLGRALWTGQG